MAAYLLDTDILINASKNQNIEANWILENIEQGNKLYICLVNILEFFAGIAPKEHSNWQEFIDRLKFIETSKESAYQAAIWRYDFARKGKQVSTPDALIAAVAKEHNLTLVTNNLKDFPMLDIKILSLSNLS